MSFLAELKRRNVIRVAIFYAVFAWLILQVADVLSGLFGLPDWSLRFVGFILLLGFPVTLVFSWVYEITPEGIKRERDISPDESITHHTARRLDVAVIVLLVLAMGMFGYDRFGGGVKGSGSFTSDASSPTAPTVNEPDPFTPADSSVAVLAFDNMSPDPENAYFAEGISEEILNVLSKIPGLQVASRTSAFSYAGTNTPIPEIADALEVAHVLEGSVRRQGDQVRITAQLIDARTDKHLWSDTFDRQLDDIFAIQDEIAEAIVAALRDALPGIKPESIDAGGTDSIEAYNAFLQGRYYLHKRGRDNVRRAIDLLGEAVELDPEFAEARAYLARALSVGWGDDDFDRALWEAKKALELDADSPIALMAFASAAERFPELIDEGLHAIERSIELKPDNAEAHHLRANYAARFNADMDTCINHERRAAELDPTALIYPMWIGFCQLGAGQPEAGIDSMAAGHRLSPTGDSLFVLAFNEAIAVGPAAARARLENDPAADGMQPHQRTIMEALIYALEGRAAEVRNQAEELEQITPEATFGGAAAWPLVIAGDIERANRIFLKHEDDPFLDTMPLILGYLPDLDLKATVYPRIMADLGVPSPLQILPRNWKRREP